MENINNTNIYSDAEVLALNVTQAQYDSVSVNRKSTFANIFDENAEFVVSFNTLDAKGGNDILFLTEVLRAAEVNNLVPFNSLVKYKGLCYRLSAIQTSELNSGLKRNNAKREDFKKSPAAPAAPQTNTAIQQQQHSF